MVHVPFLLFLSFDNPTVLGTLNFCKILFSKLYLVSAGEERGRGIAHFLDQHRRTLWIHSRGFTPFSRKQWEGVSLTLPTRFLGCLVVYLPLQYTAGTVIFSICPKCFGGRKWIQYLLPRQKSILTRTNAFHIPVQLGADLVFMVLFLMQHLCAVFHLQSGMHRTKAQRNTALLPPTKSKLVSLSIPSLHHLENLLLVKFSSDVQCSLEQICSLFKRQLQFASNQQTSAVIQKEKVNH